MQILVEYGKNEWCVLYTDADGDKCADYFDLFTEANEFMVSAKNSILRNKEKNMTLREYINTLSDEELAKLLIKEETYEIYDDDDWDDYDIPVTLTETQYETTDGEVFGIYSYNQALEHQVKLLKSKYNQKK